MKKVGLLVLLYVFIVIGCVYVSYHPKPQTTNVSVKMEITGRGYFQYGRDTKVRDDYFGRVCITNHENTTLTFWMMSCSWWMQTLIFDTDSIEFSGCGCDKNIPVKVELKPGKSIVFYPVFSDISKKRFHQVYSSITRNNKQIKIGFNLMKNVSKDRNGEPPELVKSGETYWSNPVSLDYWNNGYRIN